MPEAGIDTGKLLEAWAEIVVKKWHAQVVAMNINESKSLEESLKSSMINAGSDPNKIEFMIKLYGIFVDMGVGRGIKRGNTTKATNDYRKANNSGRKPKPWNTSVWFKQLYILKKLLTEHYGKQISESLIIQLRDVVREQHATSFKKTK